MWVESAEDVRLRRNSPVQGWLFLAVFLVAIGGASVLYGAFRHCRPVHSADHRSAAVGTFDGIDAVFFVMSAGMFQILRVHDGLRYRLTMRKARVPRSKASDVGGFIGFILIAILWGVLVHTVFASGAVDPTYLNRLPPGSPAESLQPGVIAMTATYFVLVGIVLVPILAARLFVPVDLRASAMSR